ncbi:hypothetical protein K435DRAFT_864457 [Dendrothele bispora CBS 962.96]|uniref:Uncharacterized protein n=1 Tax=Dendrothele bispora (strain CBS 962.96) TaxID=1314807 RepID=A0A4S8LMT4_DENBC|nr:hypothetical protein K435DRAFT_864457 [Dendrothele bispora CBS 962.96]
MPTIIPLLISSEVQRQSLNSVTRLQRLVVPTIIPNGLQAQFGSTSSIIDDGGLETGPDVNKAMKDEKENTTTYAKLIELKALFHREKTPNACSRRITEKIPSDQPFMRRNLLYRNRRTYPTPLFSCNNSIWGQIHNPDSRERLPSHRPRRNWMVHDEFIALESIMGPRSMENSPRTPRSRHHPIPPPTSSTGTATNSPAINGTGVGNGIDDGITSEIVNVVPTSSSFLGPLRKFWVDHNDDISNTLLYLYCHLHQPPPSKHPFSCLPASQTITKSHHSLEVADDGVLPQHPLSPLLPHHQPPSSKHAFSCLSGPPNTLPLASLHPKPAPENTRETTDHALKTDEALKMPSQGAVRHEIRKTKAQSWREWVNFMEALWKLWVATDECWARLKIFMSDKVETPWVLDGEENDDGVDD